MLPRIRQAGGRTEWVLLACPDLILTWNFCSSQLLFVGICSSPENQLLSTSSVSPHLILYHRSPCRSQVQVGASGNLAATSQVAKWRITCLPPDVPGSFLAPCRGVGRVSGLVMHQGAGKKVWQLSTSFTQ